MLLKAATKQGLAATVLSGSVLMRLSQSMRGEAVRRRQAPPHCFCFRSFMSICARRDPAWLLAALRYPDPPSVANDPAAVTTTIVAVGTFSAVIIPAAPIPSAVSAAPVVVAIIAAVSTLIVGTSVVSVAPVDAVITGAGIIDGAGTALTDSARRGEADQADDGKGDC